MSLAVAPTNLKTVAQLHREGWLEARGQLLSTSVYPELFEVVGRTWTRHEVKDGRFAIPEIHNRSQGRLSSDNPFGVLGPGDLVTSGKSQNAWLRPAPLSEWIFVGREVSDVGTIASPHR
jgi:hypothetical protein